MTRSPRPFKAEAMVSDPSTESSALLLVDGDPRLEAVRRDPATLIVEQLAGQLAELRSIRGHDPDLEEEEPYWAYFPWRRALVSLLGPRGFRALRLDRNRNKILGKSSSVSSVRRLASSV